MDEWTAAPDASASPAPDDWSPAASDDWSVAGNETPIIHRTAGERFGGNLLDAAMRNPTVADVRNTFTNPMSLAQPRQAMPGILDIPGIPLRPAVGLAGLFSRFLPGAQDVAPTIRRTEAERRKAYEEQSAADPFYTAKGGVAGKVAAGGATVGGQFLGALTDPMNWANVGKTALTRILSQGALNAGGDVATQTADVQAGLQDKWSPVQTATAGVLGAGIGGVAEGLTHAAPKVARAAGDALARYERGSSSHADVWDNLVHQESGGNQAAVSPKGAGGVAQLMPDTAKMTAKRIGRPELADIAFDNTPEGAAANETLGKAYYDQQLAAFGGNHVLAAAAYNAGPGRVRAWVRAFGHPDLIGNDAFVSKIPFSETKGYVENVARDYLGDVPAAGPARANFTEAEPGAVAQPEAPAPASVAPSPIDAEIQRRAAATAAEPAPAPQKAQDAPAPADDIPIPAKPAAAAVDDWTPTATAPLDMRDLALDHLRSGKPVPQDRGPNLMRALLDQGGLRDDGGGELRSLDLEATKGRLGKMLVRKKAGMSLDDAAGWAQDNGFLRGKYEGDAYGRASAQDLIAALHDELNGRPLYAKEDAHGAELQSHVDEIEEIVHHLGLDPQKMDNATIKAAIDDYFSGHGDGYDDLPEHLAMGSDAGTPLARRLGDSVGPDARLPKELASTQGLLYGQRNASAIPATDMANLPQLTGLHAMAQDLVNSLDLIHRQGRVGVRDALGTYNRKSGVIRTLGMQELNVLSHEAGHAMEFTHKYPTLLAVMKSYAQLLKGMDYHPKQARRHEGFAEFLRHYMTNPELARQRAPGFYEDFERAMAQDAPKVAESLKRIQNAYEAYQTSPSAAVVSSMVVEPPKTDPMSQLDRVAKDKGIPAAIEEVMANAYRGMIDRLDPVNRAESTLLRIMQRNSGQAKTLKTSHSPYRALRSAVGAASAGHVDMTHGVVPYHSLQPEGPSLSEAIAEALGPGKLWKNWQQKGIQEFGSYLAARRMAAEHARHARGELETKPALEPEVWDQAIQDFEATNPHWKDAAQMVYDWTNNLWKKRMDGGLITPEQYEAGINDHPDYVPVYRDVTDKHMASMGAVGRGGSTSKTAGGVKRFTGESERAIINPLYSLMEQAYQLNTQLAFNDARVMLDDLAQAAGPGGGLVAERIPANEIKGQKVDIKELLQNALDQGVLSERDELTIGDTLEGLEDGNPRATIFRASEINEKGEPIIYAWRDGKPTALRLPDGMWGRHMMEAFSGMPRPIQSTMLNILAAPAQWLRFGVTAHPQFFLANTIRDQLSAAMLTDVGYKPFASQMEGLRNELGQTELTRAYNIMGGPIGGAQTAAEHAAKAEGDLNAIRRAGYQIRRFGGLKELAQFTELSETGTRLGVFKNALEKARRDGLSEWDAHKEAEFQARDFMDFDRRGAHPAMQVLQRVVPFMNASLQGLDKARRVGGGILKAKDVARSLAGGPPVSAADKRAYGHAIKFWAATAGLAAAGLALRAAYKDNPEYEEIADYLRDTHWVVPLPGGDYAVIPKPFELAALSNIAERAYEGTVLKDPTAWKRMAMGLVGPNGILMPAHDSPVVAIPLQLASNKDAFGVPIEGENVQGLPAEDRVGPRTSEAAKFLGKAFHQSPLKIDYIAKAMTGSIGRNVIEGTNALIKPGAPMALDLTRTFAASRFIKDWARGSESANKFWDVVSSHDGKYEQQANLFHQLAFAAKPDDAQAALKAMTPQERAYTMARETLSGDQKLIHPLLRAPRVAGVYSDIIKDLQQGDIRGPNGPIVLTPTERRDAVRGLNHAAVADKRNALIDAGVPGWEHKALMDTDHYLAAVPAPVQQALHARMWVEFGHKPELATREHWAPQWAAVRPRMETANLSGGPLAAYMESKRTKGRAGAERQIREVTPVAR